MTQQEQIQYLANIYYAVRANGRVDGVEDSYVEEAAQGIGAGYLETRKALDLAAEKDFRMVLPLRLSDRIRNLEDIIAVCYRDGTFCQQEKDAALLFARQVGVTQEQLNAIRAEAKERLKGKRV